MATTRLSWGPTHNHRIYVFQDHSGRFIVEYQDGERAYSQHGQDLGPEILELGRFQTRAEAEFFIDSGAALAEVRQQRGHEVEWDNEAEALEGVAGEK